MKLKQEFEILRFTIGQYLLNRKNQQFRKFVSNYYKGKREGNDAYAKMLTKFKNILLNETSYYNKELLQYKDIHKGKSCFIIGNGPSLNKTDLTKINDFYKFGMNKIYLIFDRVDLRLDYYVSVNPLVIEQSKYEIENIIKCPRFLSNVAEKHIKKDDTIHFLNTRRQWNFYKDILFGLSEGYTVTFAALQIAYYMGFKNVFLIGVDHNFKQKGSPNEKQFMEEDDVNHFDKRYFKGNVWHLADLKASELSYALAKYAYERDGRKIYDATIGGKLTIFEKIDFDDAVKFVKQNG